MKSKITIIVFLIVIFLAGCQRGTPTVADDKTVPAASTFSPTSASSLFLIEYTFPEDQGIPAVSPDYSEYKYEAILERLTSFGFTVISEQRTKNTDGMKYAERVADQVRELLNADVPAKNITVVGASKGGWITIAASNYLANKELNFVVMGVCDPENIQLNIQQNI